MVATIHSYSVARQSSPLSRVMHSVALYVTGDDEYGRMLRRALMRYLNLSLILVLRSISSAVKRRFPTLDHVVDSGFMTSLELELFQSVPSLEFNTYWIPCTWFINLLKEARQSHRLSDAQGLKIIMEEFNDFRSKCGLLWSYDWVSIPLVYTQVVTLATYSFFAVALVGRQYIEGGKKDFQSQVDIYLPIFTILQFFFFMGLLKVAEQLINPFGDDDEDFELNWLIDRHMKVSYLGVDTLMNRCPPLVKDIYYDAENLTLPYTEAAAAYKKKTYRGSVANMTVPEEKQNMFLPDITEEEENTGTMPTPRTSTASLVTHANDSPHNTRRQISGSPPTTPKLSRNSSETIIQLDIQEIPAEGEQGERRSLADTVKKYSAKTKCSTPRVESQNRKPFFGLAKAARVNLQPWPSATNLTHFRTSQTRETSLSPTTARREPELMQQRKNSLKLKVPTQYKGGEEHMKNDYQGVVNSAFSQERLINVELAKEDATSSQCNASNFNDRKHSMCQSQRSYENICQHVACRDIPAIEIFECPRRPRLHSCPKYLVRRQRSVGSSRKKSVRWKPVTVDGAGDSIIRRRTIDSVPTVKRMIVQAKSSPELSNLGSILSTTGNERHAQVKEDEKDKKEPQDTE
ncbi:bestrophin homolog 17 isoform X3 [Cephus cinctus]|uniref:Bestrophin homolog n=1 Tax=Cephus cinctus TaxID=211228 RepID=A0AAJ7BTX4_CEPCN|nr:bestrophin homolog 17 isoform X3 [Cephus cinctus]